MVNDLVTVVIPIYKEKLSVNETFSLEQCCKILNKYHITLVCPYGFISETYDKILENSGVSYSFLYFDQKYFNNIEGYNELLLSVNFYRKFSNYQYILIYQLDALVFRDELEYWCLKDYDYMGAPWFKKFWRFPYSKKIYAVGNGGLSLRKVSSCIKVLEYKGKFKPTRLLFSLKNSLLVKLKKLPLKKWRGLRFENTVNFFTYLNKRTEDEFWCLDTKHSYINYNIAPIEECMKFSFECNPSLLFRLNCGKLPFGCHAWERYEPEFWRKVIQDNTIKES